MLNISCGGNNKTLAVKYKQRRGRRGEAEAPPYPSFDQLSHLPNPNFPVAKRGTKDCNTDAEVHFTSPHPAALNIYKEHTSYLLHCTYTTGSRKEAQGKEHRVISKEMAHFIYLFTFEGGGGAANLILPLNVKAFPCMLTSS